MSLAARIAKLRREKGQSLQDVADAVGVSKPHIWEIEKGRAKNPSMALVTELADHFKVSVTYLVGEDIEADDADTQLQRMFRLARDLDPRDRAVLNDTLNSMLKRRQER